MTMLALHPETKAAQLRAASLRDLEAELEQVMLRLWKAGGFAQVVRSTDATRRKIAQAHRRQAEHEGWIV
jgi:hypothetical protein